MYKHIIRFMIVSLLLFGSSVAQAEEPVYTGVDFIFLIDQSGSMCGKACGSSVETANDPYGFRFEGPKFAIIDFLGDQMSEIYISTTARIAIVEFGQEVNLSLYQVGKNDDEYENIAIEAVIPPTQIESDRQGWKVQRDNLLSDMNSYQTRREKLNLGNTDHVGAIKEANNLLDQMEQSDSSKRLKVVVLLTDGKSSICYPRGPQSDPWETDYCIPSETLFKQVEQEVNDNLDAQDYYFFVVGMADNSSNYWRDYGPGWESLAKRYNGEARLVKSQNEVAEFMGEIVNTALAKLPLPAEGPEVDLEWLPQLGYFPVRPYLQSITFYIIKRNPEDTVSIYDVQGNPLNLALDDSNCEENTCLFKLGRLVDKVVVTRPQPGKWRVEASLNKTDNLDNRVRFGIRSLFFAPELIKPTGGKYIEGSPVDLQIDMIDLDGNPVPHYEDDLYDLNTTATIKPDIAQIKLAPDTFSGHFFASQAGDSFHIHLLGTTHKPGGEEFEVLDHDVKGTFSIERLSGQLLPLAGMFQNKTASLEYQLNLQGFQALLDGYTYTGEFILSHPDLAQPLTIEATHEGDGLFTAMVQPKQAGSYTIDFKLFLLETSTNKKIPLPLDTSSDSPCCVKVEPTIGLELVLLSPANGSKEMARDWLLQLLPLQIEVGLRRSDNQQFVDWSEVRANGAGPSIPLEVRDSLGNANGVEFRTVNASETGKFLFVGDNLGLGSWRINLPQTLTLKDQYALVRVEPITATVIRVENYWAWGLWGGLTLIILGLLLVWSKHRWDISRPPYLAGYLEFLDDNDMPLGTTSFPSKRNRWVITKLPAVTGIKKLEASYFDEETINLTIDGETTMISQGTEWESGKGYKIRYENPTLDN